VNPDFTEAFVNISGACWQLGRYDDAMEAAQRALMLNCRYKEAEYNYAVSLLLLGRAMEAADLLNNLCARERDYLAAEFMLAASQVCAGDRKGGDERFRRLAISMRPDVLVLALKTLIRRMRRGGDALYADQLDRTVADLGAESEMKAQADTGDLA
jgi:tetratricopeptide (TPR) repeat protein